MNSSRPVYLVLASLTCLQTVVCGGSSCHADDIVKEKPAQEKPVQFSRDIRPILSDKCFKCHGPDEAGREAELRLDRRDDAKHVLTFDKSKPSGLLQRVTSSDPDEQMPPADSKLSLTPSEIELLRRWIKQGARYDKHWAFEPIQADVLPKVKRVDWPKNEIDRFILARIEAERLAPSPLASREKLIRRLSFDLTGLPPTLEEIDAFLADKSPDAYAKLVDRMFAKKEFGERMTANWLDVARYADSYGYQQDRTRYVWPWRDWVIKSFNQNMPYKDFVTWQLAGDLLPNATDEQILATTFNRLHSQKVEGGSTPEEFRVEYVADRTHTFGTAFLGLTLECCRCHDHKYDPVTQKEYYQLFAFFNNIDEAGLYSWYTSSVPTPTLRMANAATKAKMADVEDRIAVEVKKLQALTDERQTAFGQWLTAQKAKPDIPGRIAHLDFENGNHGANVVVPGPTGQAVRLTGDDVIGMKVGNFRRSDPFSVALWMNTPDVKERAVVFHRSKSWTDAGSRGYQLLIEEGRLSFSLIHFWPGNAIRVRTRDRIPTDTWLHIAVAYDGSSSAAGVRLFINGKSTPTVVVRDNLYKNITGGGSDNISIGARNRDRGFTRGLVDEFQVFNRQLVPIEVAQLHDGHSLADLLKQPGDALSKDQTASLLKFYLATTDAEYRKQLVALRSVREERSKTVDGITEIMVMKELVPPRQTRRLKRGAYDAPQEPVTAATPASLPPFPSDGPRNRLGLARWLTDPGNPLAARVAVNRYWQLCFGRGLVQTPEDFGSQGEPPTHPRLLDWLSRRFIESGWDVKGLLRLMVTSAAYRQTSITSPQLLKGDPDNRLLTRSPRYRLQAEMIRDNALATSGLLVKRVGGPPVRPYEVAVSFKPLMRDKGQGLYRRSLYTFWKRTAPAPVMMSLDAAKREVCVVKRERTASPLQALVLLNDPQFVEAARVLGQRMLQKHGDDIDAAAAEMFRVLTGRQPSPAERKILRKLYDEQLRDFQKDIAKAERLLKIGDAPRDASIATPRLAAAAVLASVLMNFDESVMKR
ncbi:MAG: DUF1553 domain-containing protein [Planctomycetaceae bacterium]|jgi:hypothetical protein|nr:DUF1553 domain-containing protein [Planctomycetaceae bacterium]MBT6496417.1 DUF1553 domain-containing protein [Planctomycetaceae bacterium]